MPDIDGLQLLAEIKQRLPAVNPGGDDHRRTK